MQAAISSILKRCDWCYGAYLPCLENGSLPKGVWVSSQNVDLTLRQYRHVFLGGVACTSQALYMQPSVTKAAFSTWHAPAWG